LADLCWIESQAGLGTVAEPHHAEIVGVLVDEISADPESARDLVGVNEVRTCVTSSQEVGHSCRYCLYVRFAERHRYSCCPPRMSFASAICIGYIRKIPETPPAIRT
jgi:hypothetical protein